MRDVGALPSPRNPGLLGLRIIVRKSGRPDLRWGGVGGGGREMRHLRCATTTPLPSPPPQGGREPRREQADVRPAEQALDALPVGGFLRIEFEDALVDVEGAPCRTAAVASSRLDLD